MNTTERLATIGDSFKEMGWDTVLGRDTVKRDASGAVIAARDSNQLVHDIEEATGLVEARGALSEVVGRSVR